MCDDKKTNTQRLHFTFIVGFWANSSKRHVICILMGKNNTVEAIRHLDLYLIHSYTHGGLSTREDARCSL